jgi:hypothetical protein
MGEFLTRNSSLQIAFSRDSFGDQAVFALPRPSGEPLATHISYARSRIRSNNSVPRQIRMAEFASENTWSDLELPEQFRRCHRTVANRIQFSGRDRSHRGGVHAYRRRIHNPC